MATNHKWRGEISNPDGVLHTAPVVNGGKAWRPNHDGKKDRNSKRAACKKLPDTWRRARPRIHASRVVEQSSCHSKATLTIPTVSRHASAADLLTGRNNTVRLLCICPGDMSQVAPTRHETSNTRGALQRWVLGADQGQPPHRCSRYQHSLLLYYEYPYPSVPNPLPPDGPYCRSWDALPH
jgi:hypothetical protein